MAIKVLGRTGFLALKIAVTALFAYLANRSLGRQDIGAVIDRLHGGLLAVSLGLAVAAVIAQTLRWRIVLAGSGFPVSLATALRTFLWGNALAFVTPGRVGEFARGLELSGKHKFRTAVAVAIDKVFIVGTTLAAAFVFLCLRALMYGNMTKGSYLFAVLLVVCTGVILVVLVRGDPPMPKSWGLARETWSKVPRLSTREGRGVVLWSLVAHGALLVQTAILLRMFGSHSFGANLVASGQAYALMVFVPISIANMGVREYAFGFYLAQLAVIDQGGVAGICLAASVLVMIMNIILPALAGLLWELVDNRQGNSKGGDGGALLGGRT